jgi:PKD repeat protein
MKRQVLFFNIITMIGFMAFSLVSCDEESSPTAYVNVNPYIEKYDVTWAVKAVGVSSFTWDYGDGTQSNESEVHTHTYAASGEYTVTVTATGDAGTATTTETITIAPSIEEIIAGPDNSGKTWVLTQDEGAYPGIIGPGPVDNGMSLLPILVPSGVIAYAGLGDEYPDEFIFYKDGTFEVDIKNGLALGGLVYGMGTNLIRVPSSIPDDLPLCALAYQNVTGATWELSYEDKVVTTFNMFSSQTIEDITYTFPENGKDKVAELKLSSGAYVGFTDLTYPPAPEMGLPNGADNSFYIIKKVTPEAIHVAIGINGYPSATLPDGTPVFMYPTFTLHLTLVPK